MSVDLSILVKHDFYDTNDPVACENYMNETIAGLQKYFMSEDIVEDVRFDYDYSFYLKPVGSIRVRLHKGCWEFETCFSYVRYFLKDKNNRNPLRDLAYDLARAFGKEEVWITDEHHGWFGILGDVTNSFEEWLVSPSNKEGFSDDVVEYDPENLSNVNVKKNNISTKYHDSLKEPKEDFKELKSRFPGYRLLTACPAGGVLLGEKDNKLYALNIVNGKPFVDYPIDGINDSYNTVVIEIYKDGKSALFSNNGEQLTAYGEHDFNWGWDVGDNRKVRITDNITGEFWVFPI